MTIDAPPSLEQPPERPAPPRGRGPIGLIIAVGVVLVLIGGVAFATAGRGGSDPAAGTPSWNGSTVEPALPRPSFTLTGTDGQPYDFAARTTGKLTFLFFGYTNCPDVCPISMATLTSALSDLSGVGAEIVFVTTDPARDTPERLDEWLSSFPFRVTGLTGTPEQLAAAQKAAGVTVAIAEEPDAKGRYTVGHSAAMNVYTADDQQHLRYPSGTTQAQWMADIPKIVAQPDWSTTAGPTVLDAYAGPSSAGSEAVYVSLANSGPDDVLVGVSSPAATSAMLHRTEGTTMTDADEIDLPSGGQVAMGPGGTHVMLSGLTGPVAEGGQVTVVLSFRSAPPLAVKVPVVSFDALAQKMGS